MTDFRLHKFLDIRAFTAFSVDWIVCNVISMGINYVAYHYFERYIFSDLLQVESVKLLLLAIYFLWLPKHWNKQTIGNALVKVKIVSDAEDHDEVTTKELLNRNVILYMFEPAAVLTASCLIFFPACLAILLNSIAKKGGLPHNTWTKTHLELEGHDERR